MWRLFSSLALAGVLIAACEGGAGPVGSVSPPPGADTPMGAVESLVDALGSPDFEEASRYAMPGQAALAALAEGASFSQVAEALREGDQDVAANFWAGFAQSTGSFLTAPVGVTDDGVVELSGTEFHSVSIELPSGGTRSILVRSDDGYRIDLFASFGPGLSDKMLAPVDRLLVTQTPDARLILTRLQEIVPSLLAASQVPGTPLDVAQQLLALVELITRVG